MTISVKVSCNGNYRCPVSYRQGQTEQTILLDGSITAPQPDERSIPFYHGQDAMSLTIGPEEQIRND